MDTMAVSVPITRRLLLAAAGTGAVGVAHAQGAPEHDPWPELAQQIFGTKPVLQSGASFLAIDAPYRALDASVVPLTLRILPQPPGAAPIRKITLVIDQNPSPLAASFTLGRRAEIDMVATRVRVDDYTNIHAVAETADGALHVVARFVKAAGGCSAPALKADVSTVPLGTMRLRELPPSGNGARREVQVMIRHPNYSGMQMDQITRLYIPAHFVKSLTLWQGDERLFAVESGISISENPAFRIRFLPHGDAPFRAVAIDSENKRFHGEWKAATPS